MIERLQFWGYAVDYDERGDVSYRKGKTSPPSAFVIDLSRLPAHGRDVAIGFRGAKGSRHVPIVFVDGEAEKVAAIRVRLPDAAYTTASGLRGALRKAIANPPPAPVVPRQMMEGYADRTAAQKLGIQENMRVAVIDAPAGYAAILGGMPAGVEFDEEAEEPCAVTLWFVRDADEYASGMRRMRARAGGTKLWILWPKASARKSAITQHVVRQTANEFGLVDYKICSVNEGWSGMCFAPRRT